MRAVGAAAGAAPAIAAQMGAAWVGPTSSARAGGPPTQRCTAEGPNAGGDDATEHNVQALDAKKLRDQGGQSHRTLGQALSSHAIAETLSGSAKVMDADTIAMKSERIRLFGIDAPEGAQQCRDVRQRRWDCGSTATHRLDRLIDGRAVTCTGDERDLYGRLIAICSVAGRELNAQLVREGLAWAFVKYSTAYLSIEEEARAAKLGVFAAENTAPWIFREERWNAARASTESEKTRECPIKGNISRKGRIYHMPWHRDYDRVKLNESLGERWFCDEGEAHRAGWRTATR
jgi:endonuclease YncB( thermonuclease family)